MEWIYYLVCVVVFLLMGLLCGYLVWRKGHLQTLDAESEVARASRDLRKLREDLRIEENVLRTEEEAEATANRTSSSSG